MPAFIVYSCADRNTVRSLLSYYKTDCNCTGSFFAWCARVHATWEVSLNEHCMRTMHSSSSCAWNCTCESPLPHTRYRSCSASFQRVQISCTQSSPALHAWQCTLLQKPKGNVLITHESCPKCNKKAQLLKSTSSLGYEPKPLRSAIMNCNELIIDVLITYMIR